MMMREAVGAMASMGLRGVMVLALAVDLAAPGTALGLPLRILTPGMEPDLRGAVALLLAIATGALSVRFSRVMEGAERPFALEQETAFLSAVGVGLPSRLWALALVELEFGPVMAVVWAVTLVRGGGLVMAVAHELVLQAAGWRTSR